MVLCMLLGAVLLLRGEAAAQLPQEIQADRYLVAADRYIETGEYAAAQAALERVLELQATHGVELPEAFWFMHAEVAYQAGAYAEAVESVTRYLMTAGREGTYYRAALALLDRAEAGPPRELRNSLGLEFVLIEPGTFAMGSPETETERSGDEGPVHQVTLSQPFYLGKYEVTQEQWAAVMGSNPSYCSDCGGNCPVERVSWEDAQEFIAALNRQEGVNVYRLPTEAEWEYAARAGTRTTYHLWAYAWYRSNSNVGICTHPVGQKMPNRWGLYDMLGNVWEWTADWYGPYTTGSVTDPRGPSTGARRVYRGGSLSSFANDCRAARRSDAARPGGRGRDLGFRLARTP